METPNSTCNNMAPRVSHGVKSMPIFDGGFGQILVNFRNSLETSSRVVSVAAATVSCHLWAKGDISSDDKIFIRVLNVVLTGSDDGPCSQIPAPRPPPQL